MLMGSVKVFYKLDYKPYSKVYALTYTNNTITQNLVLKEGWNLVSFYVNLDFPNLIGNSSILEIKNGAYSYNSSVPNFVPLGIVTTTGKCDFSVIKIECVLAHIDT